MDLVVYGFFLLRCQRMRVDWKSVEPDEAKDEFPTELFSPHPFPGLKFKKTPAGIFFSRNLKIREFFFLLNSILSQIDYLNLQ